MDSNAPATISSSKPSHPPAEEFLTREQLRDRLNLKTVHAVDHLRRAKKITPHSLGKKTTRYYWPDVVADLARFRTPAINPDNRRGSRKATD